MNAKLSFLIVMFGASLISLRVQAEASAQVDTAAGSQKSAPLALSLKDATSRALTESRKIKKAKADYTVASAESDVARAAFLPTLYLESNLGTLHDREPSPGETTRPLTARDRNQYQAQLVLRQKIFNGFRDLHEVRAKNAARSEGEWQLKSTALDVSLDVIAQYFGLQRARAELEAELQVYKLREQQLSEVKSRAAQGRATSLEALESEYALRSQDPTIKSLRRDIAGASLKLARLTGIGLDESFKLTDDLTDVGAILGSAKIPDLAKAYEDALRESPQLKKSEATLERLDWERAMDTSAHLPTISLEAMGGYRSGLRRDFGTEDSLNYSGMINLSVPLFSGLSSFDERRKNAARMSAATEEQALVREQLLQDLSDAFRDLELAESKVEAGKKNTELSGKAVENAKSLFRNGRVTQSNVLDSYSRDLTARRDYVKSLYDRIMALAKIRSLTAP